MKITTIILYLLISFVAYYLIHKLVTRQKYINFFTDIGISSYFLSKMTTDELYTAWNYVKNYSMKGIQLTPQVDPVLYAKAKAVNDKYHIFSNLN